MLSVVIRPSRRNIVYSNLIQYKLSNEKYFAYHFPHYQCFNKVGKPIIFKYTNSWVAPYDTFLSFKIDTNVTSSFLSNVKALEVEWRLDGGWMEVDGNGKSLDKENSEEINSELLEQVLLK